MTVSYSVNIGREQDKGPADHHKTMFFHYVLDLDEAGSITGGRFAGDSAQIDMLWTPLQPAQGGQEKNKRGNPHLNIKEVLAIWRDSVPEDLRNKWLNIDPTDEDRILSLDEKPAAIAAESTTPAAEVTATNSATNSSTTAGPATTDTPAVSVAPTTTEAASPAAPTAPAPAVPAPAPAASPE
jgi:hypothetical protein